MKVSELEGAELDYWVAKAEGLNGIVLHPAWPVRNKPTVTDSTNNIYSPSERWSQGGPIIEREGINLKYDPLCEMWDATKSCEDGTYCFYVHKLSLVAGMRVRVASKFGEEVDASYENES